MAPAVEDGSEFGTKAADGVPAATTVPVSVPCIYRAAVVGVEVQVRRQLVPGATAARAAHARDGVRESHDIVGSMGGSVRRAVSVQIPADGIQLRQVAYINQAIIVPVVVVRLRRDRRRGRCRWGKRWCWRGRRGRRHRWDSSCRRGKRRRWRGCWGTCRCQCNRRGSGRRWGGCLHWRRCGCGRR